jgi:hypothetical protein
MKIALAFFSTLVYASCGEQAPEQGRAAREQAEQARPDAAAPSPSLPGTGPNCAQPPPLTLKLSAQATPSGIALSVVNPGPRSVRLASAVALSAAGRAVDAQALHLLRTCAAEECVALEPGAELLSPPWFNHVGDAERCGTLLTPTQPGTYELVVRSCECAQEQRVTVEWPPP